MNFATSPSSAPQLSSRAESEESLQPLNAFIEEEALPPAARKDQNAESSSQQCLEGNRSGSHQTAEAAGSFAVSQKGNSAICHSGKSCTSLQCGTSSTRGINAAAIDESITHPLEGRLQRPRRKAAEGVAHLMQALKRPFESPADNVSRKRQACIPARRRIEPHICNNLPNLELPETSSDAEALTPARKPRLGNLMSSDNPCRCYIWFLDLSALAHSSQERKILCASNCM